MQKVVNKDTKKSALTLAAEMTTEIKTKVDAANVRRIKIDESL